jgi:hypothetical protein
MERGFFPIINFLFGGGQPCGLAAALARGRRPPKAGGGPTKSTDLHSETLCIKLVLYGKWANFGGHLFVRAVFG